MKCRSRIDENSVNEYEQSLLMDNPFSSEEALANSNKDELIKEFLRKNFVKFYINIYKDQVSLASHGSKASNLTPGGGPGSSNMSSNNTIDDTNVSRYMLDIHLFKGTVYVFMDFVRKFLHVLTVTCSLCTSNSCCSSSNHSSNMDSRNVG